MTREMAELVAQSIVAIDCSYEPAMPCEDVIILDLLSEDLADRVSAQDVRRILGLPRGDRWNVV